MSIDNDELAAILQAVILRPKDPVQATIALFRYYDFLKEKRVVKLNEFLTLCELLDRTNPVPDVVDYWLGEFSMLPVENVSEAMPKIDQYFYGE